MSRSLSPRHYTRTKRERPFEGWALDGYNDALAGKPPRYGKNSDRGIRTTYARGYRRGQIERSKTK